MIRAVWTDRPLRLRLLGLGLMLGLQWVLDAYADELERGRVLEAEPEWVDPLDLEDDLGASDLDVFSQAQRPPCRPCRDAADAGHPIRCRCDEALRQQHAGREVEALLRQMPDGQHTATLTANLRMTGDDADLRELHQELPSE